MFCDKVANNILGKIAYIEYNKVHQEIIPIFIYLAKIKNYYIDIFLLNENLNNNVFYYVEDKFDNFKVQSIDNLSYEIEKNNYIYGILGSGETLKWITDFLKLNIPKKFIIRHNYTKLNYNNNNIKEIVLSEHILKLNNNLTPIYPIYFGKYNESLRNNNYYLIQGNLEYKRRNYLSLIDCAIKLKNNNINNDKVKFIILGRFSNKTNPEYPLKLDGDDFMNKLIENNICDYFEINYGATEYKEYFEIINKCKFILPLVDNTYDHKYFYNKITSSINIGIGFNQKFVINETIANLYNIDGFIYKNNDLYDGIIKSLDKNNIDDDHNNFDKFMNKNLFYFNNLIT